MASATYTVNQVLQIKNKRVILLLDSYGPRNKNNIEVLSTTPGFNFSVIQNEIESVRKSYKDIKIFGFWSLLYHKKLIDTQQKSGFYVVYTDKQKTEGFYLFFNNNEARFLTGLIIGGKIIGAFDLNIDDAKIISVNTKDLELANEILLPVERKRIKQQFYQKITISNVAVIIIAIFIGFFITTFITDNKEELQQIKKEISKTNKYIKNIRNNITLANINNIPTDLNSARLLPAFAPLAELSMIRAKDLSFETAMTQEFSFSITKEKIAEEIPLWLSGLSSNFKITEDNNTIFIKWQKDNAQ